MVVSAQMSRNCGGRSGDIVRGGTLVIVNNCGENGCVDSSGGKIRGCRECGVLSRLWSVVVVTVSGLWLLFVVVVVVAGFFSLATGAGGDCVNGPEKELCPKKGSGKMPRLPFK